MISAQYTGVLALCKYKYKLFAKVTLRSLHRELVLQNQFANSSGIDLKPVEESASGNNQ